VTLSAVEPAELPSALAAVLRGPWETGGAGTSLVVAPLPVDPIERSAALAMLRPSAPVTEPDAAAVVVTSGSTGQPKGVVLSRAAIVASAKATHARLGGPGDWLLALPTHYVAGFMVLARTLVAGTEVHHVGPDLSGVPAALERAARPTYLSLVATQLSRALTEPLLAAALGRVDAVLLGGGPAPDSLLSRASANGIRVVTTYGMSETCGGCVYDGRPLDGVGVAIGEDGTVALSGPMMFSGYRLRPDLTSEVLDGVRFRTSDRGRCSDGRLEVLGRLDDVVISGGLNVDLSAVERAALPWAERRSGTVAMVGVPDPEWGTAVIAVTDALRSDNAGDPEGELADLRADLARSLPAHALPKRLVHRSPIPRTAGGKIDRHRLRTELAVGVGTEGHR
jgi:o-succinylbenzoate---CoA ligase